MASPDQEMRMSPKNTLCLWYDGSALEAAQFYAATFPDSAVTGVFLAPSDYPSGKAGDVLTVTFTVMGIPCVGLNGGPAFPQSEAFSFQILTEDQDETDRYWNAIVGNGGQESACGWCKDKWGISWQITRVGLTEAIKDRTGAFVVHIPYRGSSQILSDLVSGQIDVAVTTVTSAVPMLAAGRLKILGVSSRERVPMIKDVPTFSATASLKGLEMNVWAVLFAPPGTPDAVVQKLNGLVGHVLTQPTMKAMTIKLGAEVPPVLGPGQTREFLAAQRWAAVGTLAAGVAHEINTPIQFVNDNVHFLQSAARQLLAAPELDQHEVALTDLEALSLSYILAAFERLGVFLQPGTRLQAHQLAHPQATGVEQLQHGFVAHAERRGHIRSR